MRLGMKVRLFASVVAASAAISVMSGTAAHGANGCSVWLVESSRFMKVPFGAFMPDRAFVPGSTNPNNNIPTVDLPANYGVIKCGTDADPLRYRLETAGLSEDDRIGSLGVGP